MAGLRAAVAAGLRHQLSIAAGDAVPGTDRHLQRPLVHGKVADRGAGDLHHLGHSDAGRPVQHPVHGRAADVPVLRRRAAVLLPAEEREQGELVRSAVIAAARDRGPARSIGS